MAARLQPRCCRARTFSAWRSCERITGPLELDQLRSAACAAMRPLAVPQFRRLRRRKSHYDRVKRMGIRLSAIKIGYLTRHSQVSSSAESLTREPQQMTAPGAEEKLRRDGGCFRFCTPF